MAYIQSELEQAVEMLEPRLTEQITTTGIWFEELQKALIATHPTLCQTTRSSALRST